MIRNYSLLLYVLALMTCALSVALLRDFTGIFVGALIGSGIQSGITGTLLMLRPFRDVSVQAKVSMLVLAIIMSALAAISVGLMLI